MTDSIRAHLKRLADAHDIEILLAVETGSRAWGFPSPDSDYDVRLIYVHRPEWYLTVGHPKDSLEAMLDDRLIDVTGWELRKTLRLLAKSNPALLDRLQSPIVYRHRPGFVEEMQSLAEGAYSRVAALNHYLSMGEKMYREQLAGGADYRLKAFFYVLRCAALCRWIMDRNTIPPIAFRRAVELTLPPPLRPRLKELLDLKGSVNETYRHRGESELLHFAATTFAAAAAVRHDLPAGRPDRAAMDALLHRYVL